ncbi:MAG: M23 family metallopeptidase [Rikenellaceae bacterium]
MILCLCTSLLCSHGLAQRSQYGNTSVDRLPKVPLDTIDTTDPETKIIIYANNTWEYYRASVPDRVQSSLVYKEHWDTTSIFSYRSIELGDLDEIVELRLVDSLSEFSVPYQGKVFSKYGVRRGRRHNGVDLALKVGDPIYATFEGVVRYARYNTGGYGYLVIIRHPNGLETWHAHLTTINSRVGDYVKAGEVIGYGGSTGRSTGAHLHFEVRYKDQSFDPEFLIDFASGQLKFTTFALEKRYLNIYSRASEMLEEENYEEDLMAAGLLDPEQAKSESVKKEQDPSEMVYHVVKSGDMLGKIAIKYGTTVTKICQLNGISRTTTLRLKQRLRVR